MSKPYQDAADEIAAYDLVEELIKREGVRMVLATLRCWYLSTAAGNPAGAYARRLHNNSGVTR